jgi:anti-anti-sigma factor
MREQPYRSPILEITASCRPAGATLACRGEIDLSSADYLDEALQAWTETEVPTLTVDLRETAYLDSSIVESLLRAHTRMELEGRHLRILVRPRRARIFQVLRLNRVLDISSGSSPEPESLASLRTPEARRILRARGGTKRQRTLADSTPAAARRAGKR